MNLGDSKSVSSKPPLILQGGMMLQELFETALKHTPDLFSSAVTIFNRKEIQRTWSESSKLLEFLRSAESRWADYSWPLLSASLFRAYRLTGNRRDYERIHFERRALLSDLMLLHAVEPSPVLLNRLIDAVWVVCEESFWGVPAHNAVTGVVEPDLCDVSEPIVDLFAAETGAHLAWIGVFAEPELSRTSPLLQRRIESELSRRIVRPFLEREDFWWMGRNLKPGQRVNNWNPWIISNVLTTVVLLDCFDGVRAAVVEKSCRLLDLFLEEYGADGGCDEGPHYWTKAAAALFDALDLLYRATGGALDGFSFPLVAQMGRYIHRVHIHGDSFVNFADGSALLDTVPANLVRRYGERIGDTELLAFGAFREPQQGIDWSPPEDVPESTLRRVFRYRALVEDSPVVESSASGLLHTWMADIQVMTARSTSRTQDGFFLACKGGHNNENHNHNDVGNFILSYRGNPVLIDLGVETYTAKTFGPRRYEIWTMRSAFHNLPTVNGIEQSAGEAYRASSVFCVQSDGQSRFEADITDSYPKTAGIRSWHRAIALNRSGPQTVDLVEHFFLDAETMDLSLSLMTPWCPQRRADGQVDVFNGPPETRSAIVLEIPDSWTITWNGFPIEDPRLRTTWPETVYRILLKPRRPLSSGEHRFHFRESDSRDVISR